MVKRLLITLLVLSAVPAFGASDSFLTKATNLVTKVATAPGKHAGKVIASFGNFMAGWQDEVKGVAPVEEEAVYFLVSNDEVDHVTTAVTEAMLKDKDSEAFKLGLQKGQFFSKLKNEELQGAQATVEKDKNLKIGKLVTKEAVKRVESVAAGYNRTFNQLVSSAVIVGALSGLAFKTYQFLNQPIDVVAEDENALDGANA